MNSIENILVQISNSRGTQGGWPGYYEYKVENDSAIVRLMDIKKDREKKQLRGIDAWGLAFFDTLNNATNNEIKKLSCRIDGRVSPLNVEALKRRLSYLNINNPEESFELILNNEDVKLYSREELIKRPAEEIIRQKINPGSDDDKSGRVEKDFQTFLFGKGIEKDERSNERSAILGEDFYQLQGKDLGVLREFPTGVFKKEVSDDTRMLPTEFIDIVTLNKWKKLSIIELKVNDPSLEVITQLVDYALFFACYIKDLKKLIEDNSSIKLQDSNEFVCYVVNNHFHDNFNRVIRYYTPKDFEFEVKKVTLGYTVQI